MSKVTPIYGNESISNIVKLSPREFPHLVQNRKDICMQKLWRIQYTPGWRAAMWIKFLAEGQKYLAVVGFEPGALIEG